MTRGDGAQREATTNQGRPAPSPSAPGSAWGSATAHGNYATASKGRIGVLVSVGAAVLAGGGVAWMNWLLTVGSSL